MVCDSGCPPQIPSLNEFQSEVDEIIKTDIQSKIMEVSDFS